MISVFEQNGDFSANRLQFSNLLKYNNKKYQYTYIRNHTSIKQAT